MIRIRSKKPGFRRGGLAHACEWTEYPDGRFSKKELARLQAEPMLQVEVVPDAAANPKPIADDQAIMTDSVLETESVSPPPEARKTSKSASARQKA